MEPQFRFDNSLTSEERFRFRKWIQEFSHALTQCDQSLISSFLASNFTSLGLSDAKLNKTAFTMLMSSQKRKSQNRLCFFTELRIFGRETDFSILGSYAETEHKELVLEGGIDIKVQKDQEFKIQKLNFSPRLKIS